MMGKVENQLISVIIPVYGVEKYIGKCLESVIQQTYKNLEIIVINDGTKDKSAEIAKKYAAKDHRIKVYDYPNGGLSVARNRGLEHAHGDYIAFLDSDDWLDLKMYETLIKVASDNDADMVKCGFMETDENIGGKIFSFKNQISINNKNKLDYYFKGVLWTVVWNALYKKDVAKQVFFPENIIHEDNYSSGIYLYLAKKVVAINYVGYFYRINFSGLSKGGVKKPLDKILSINKLILDLRKLNYLDARLDWKISVEIFHFIRGLNSFYNVVGMRKSLYNYLSANLDWRRKVHFFYLLRSKNIKILPEK